MLLQHLCHSLLPQLPVVVSQFSCLLISFGCYVSDMQYQNTAVIIRKCTHSSFFQFSRCEVVTDLFLHFSQQMSRRCCCESGHSLREPFITISNMILRAHYESRLMQPLFFHILEVEGLQMSQMSKKKLLLVLFQAIPAGLLLELLYVNINTDSDRMRGIMLKRRCKVRLLACPEHMRREAD